MGQILNEQNIIEKNILQYLQNTYSTQSKRLTGTPIYVTYLNKSINYSDQDRVLETVKEVIGVESPIAYNRIENLPLYLVNEVNPNLELDESFGLTTTGEGEGVILPDTIKPYVDDFFKINYMDEEFLFQINKIEFDKLNGKKFYKLSFHLSQYNESQVEEQIKDDYIVEYDNIGTKNNPIIEKKSYLLISEIREIILKLKKFYFDMFMNNKYKVILYQYNDKIIYNDFLLNFIQENNILENNERKILNSYYIYDLFEDSPAKTQLYNDTIYYALTENKKEYFKMENLVTFKILKNYKTSPFSLDYEDYYRVHYIPAGSHNEILTELDNNYNSYMNDAIVYYNYNEVFGRRNNPYFGFIDEDKNKSPLKNHHIKIIPHNNYFVDYVQSNIKYNDNYEYYLENIIIDYLNNTLKIDDVFLDDLKQHKFLPCFKEFLLVPCLILVLKREIIRLTNK